jgi:hypothetical protein
MDVLPALEDLEVVLPAKSTSADRSPAKGAPIGVRGRIDLGERRMPRPRPQPDPVDRPARADQVHPERPLRASAGS